MSKSIYNEYDGNNKLLVIQVRDSRDLKMKGRIHMTFLEKIEPYLTSDDLLVQDFVLDALQDYPCVPAEWTMRLLKEALCSKEKELSILVNISNHPFNGDAVKILIDGIKNAEKSMLDLYLKLLAHIEPELAMKYKHELKRYISKETWDFYHLLLHGTEEEVWEEYGAVLAELENAKRYDHSLFMKAKKLMKKLVQNEWMDEREIDLVLEEELNNEWFSYTGIITVYAIGLLKFEKYIPLLASLLVRDDDILLEEVSAALIAFQSDEVVRAVEPYVSKGESEIFAVSVLANTKTTQAVEVLRKAYKKTDDEEMKALIIEALCHHLTKEALPEIEQYIRKGYTSFLIDKEHVLYGYFTVMGIHHHELEKWKRIATARDESFRKKMKQFENMESSNKNRVQITTTHRKLEKIGRNDPCPCGSGKKYKKCCMV